MKSTLDKLYPWPDTKPEVPSNDHGWFRGRPRALREFLPDNCRCILELGAWLGASTRWFAEECPDAQVITIDHWKGDLQIASDPNGESLLPISYQTFIVNCWDYRHRIIPIKETTIDGLNLVAATGVLPDLVYIDAAHDEESVKSDLGFCLDRFSTAVIAGDDWRYFEVKPGVLSTMSDHQIEPSRLRIIDNVWCLAPNDQRL